MDKNNQNQTNTNRHKWRPFVLIMALAVCVASAFVVGREMNAPTTEQSPTTEETVETLGSVKPPDETVMVYPGSVADFEGGSFKILVADKERNTGFDGGSAPTILSRIDADEGQMLAFDLNIDLKVVRLADPVAYVMAAHAANEGDTADLLVLDLFVENTSELNHHSADLLAGGLLADLNRVENVHLDGDGYYTDINTALSVRGKTFLAASDATAGFRDSLVGVIFDKEQLNVAPSELAATVESGKWTLDALHGIVKEQSGNGIYTDCNEAVVWMLGMGARDAVPTEDGFRVSVTENGAVELFGKLKGSLYGNVSSKGVVGSADAVFRQGTVGEFGTLDTATYGMLPLPKATEQGSYVSVADPSRATVMAITSFCDDRERSGTVMDNLVKRTAEHFAEAYINDVSRGDTVSRASIEKMFESRSVCVIAVLGYPDTLEDACETLILGKNTDLNAFLKQRSYFLQNALDIIVSDIAGDEDAEQ